MFASENGYHDFRKLDKHIKNTLNTEHAFEYYREILYSEYVFEYF